MIRPATEADIPGMHRVRLLVRENRLSDPARVTPADYERLLRAGGRGWVAEREGHVVAFAVADLHRANVWALFVEPGFEGLGIGRELHAALLQEMFAAGLPLVWLSTDPGTRAERFYRRMGWKAAGVEPNGEVRFEMTPESWRTAQDSFTAPFRGE